MIFFTLIYSRCKFIAAVYGSISATSSVDWAATSGIIVNVIFGVLSIILILIMVPKNDGKPSNYID